MDLAEVVKHWRIVRRDLLRALDVLTDEQLVFVPRDGLWSMGKFARHIAEAEEGWFRYAVTRELEEWPEFRDEDHVTVASIKTVLSEVHERTQVLLETPSHQNLAALGSTSAGLETVVETPRVRSWPWTG